MNVRVWNNDGMLLILDNNLSTRENPVSVSLFSALAKDQTWSYTARSRR
jgi:hypothetical protein